MYELGTEWFKRAMYHVRRTMFGSFDRDYTRNVNINRGA